SVLCAISERGSTQLYRVTLQGEMTALTPPDHEMGCFSVSADGSRFGILMGNATDLYEATVWDVSAIGSEPIVNYLVNQDVFAEVQLQEPEEIIVRNPEGGSVPAWMLKPDGFDAAKRYPCVLYVHGGPALQYGGKAAPFHELNFLASNGYVVLFSNPRGSKGYGEEHTQAIKGDWGNKDWIDVQSVADYGAALPFVDEKRMAIMGGSY